jgi:hypothetical protein
VWDFGGPVAHSKVDISGGSGFASLPFPGAAGVVGAGLVLNLAGLSDTVPTPEYPFYAGAQYPATPTAQVGQPGSNYALSAKADQKAATSAAEFRGGPKEGFVGESLAHSDVSEVDGTVVAKAESVNKGISIGGGALTIGSVLSRATATLGQDGTVTSTSQLLMDGLEVAGSPAGLSPEGLDEAALNQALAPMGLSVNVVKGQTTSSGVRADAFEVKFVHPIPEGGGNSGTIVYRFGGASADIVTGSDPAADEPSSGQQVAQAVAPAPAAPAPDPASVTPAAAPAPAAPQPVAPAVSAPAASVTESAAPELRFEPVAALTTPDTDEASSSWTAVSGLAIVGAVVLLASLPVWLRLGRIS